MKVTARTYGKVILNLVTALVILLLCIFLLPRAIVFFMPFIIGWIISLIVAPVVRFLEKKLKIRRKASSAFVIIAVLAIVVLIVYAINSRLYEQVLKMLNDLPNMWSAVEQEFNQIGQNLAGFTKVLPQTFQDSIYNLSTSFGDYVADLLSGVGSPTWAAVSSIARRLPEIFIAVIITILAAYFFVADKSYMGNALRKYLSKPLYYRLDLIRRSFARAFGGYFKAELKIELVIYCILVIGLAVLGFNYSFLIAIGIAIVDILPVFGAGTILLPWAVISFFGGQIPRTIGFLIIWGVTQLVRHIIEPKVVGDSVGIHPIPTLFLLYIGYELAGVIGMVFVVPIAMIIVYLNEEGMFDTTKDSFHILVAGFNEFRRLNRKDKEIISQYDKDAAATYQKEILAEQMRDMKKEKKAQEAAKEPDTADADSDTAIDTDQSETAHAESETAADTDQSDTANTDSETDSELTTGIEESTNNEGTKKRRRIWKKS